MLLSDNEPLHLACIKKKRKKENTAVGVIWLTNQRACEPVIQITVCGGYLLLLVPQICGTSVEPDGWFGASSLLCANH